MHYDDMLVRMLCLAARYQSGALGADLSGLKITCNATLLPFFAFNATVV